VLGLPPDVALQLTRELRCASLRSALVGDRRTHAAEAEVCVAFDPARGYPTRITFDGHWHVTDDELHVDVSRAEVLRDAVARASPDVALEPTSAVR